jgi:hypothetical protein
MYTPLLFTLICCLWQIIFAGPIYVGDLVGMRSPDVSGVRKQPSLSGVSRSYDTFSWPYSQRHLDIMLYMLIYHRH